ncbi:hypothetical protein DPMN_160738 [Dreissena polymorpha]|uniref:Uncharacterized protein n=1 Tax=Dreissena polymorpha TaxID=45954 RepID=A0A9D4EP27_DREPO|nr:hypothetical protein DPMN_160738 [Dreissena polymorpha]
MARIKSDWRASLQPDMLNCLIAISISGPAVGEYNCTRTLNLWYTRGQRQRRPVFDDEDVEENLND